jgi:hypothetical protein
MIEGAGAMTMFMLVVTADSEVRTHLVGEGGSGLNGPTAREAEARSSRARDPILHQTFRPSHAVAFLALVNLRQLLRD